MKKFGILYICTGCYDIFRKDFYQSCEKNLLIDCDIEKHYFVWTDSDKIRGDDRIHIYFQENLGRPDNTLKRFHMFLSQEKELEKMDYLFFFNANLEIKKYVGTEILPTENDMIVVTQHPAFYKCKNTKFTYDRNPKSTAFIKKGEGNYYVQGALNGGTSYSYLKMCKELVKNIDIDKSNGVVALRHDESHLNKYIYDLEKNSQDNKFMVLPPSYLYVEFGDLPFECKILARDKEKYLNIDKIKNISRKKRVRKYLNKQIYRIYKGTINLIKFR